MISVVMVQYNRPDLTVRAVNSLVRNNPDGYEIVIVDNSSSDLNTQPPDLPDSVRWMRSERNNGFGSACNLGASHCEGEILLFLNNDIDCKNDIIRPLERYVGNHLKCGAVGLGLDTPVGVAQISAGRFPTMLQEWKSKRGIPAYSPDAGQAVDWVTGAALAIRSSLFRALGGFDENYFMYFEDIDLCKRVWQRKYEVHFVPEIRLVHLGGGSQPDGMPPDVQIEYRRSQLRYYRKHASLSQRACLRGYLAVKFGVRFAVGGREGRIVAGPVLRDIVR